MKAKAIGPLLAAALLVGAMLSAAAAVPSGAGAAPKPRTERTRREVVETLALRGTHGFIIDLKARDRRRIVLSTVKLHGLFDIRGATYELRAPQAYGSDDIDARIGRFGRIDVRFVPESVSKEPSPLPRCHGPKTIVEEGRYVGTIAFRGEGGYTSVHASSAPAGIIRTPPLECKPLVLSRRSRQGNEGAAEARHHKGGSKGEPIGAVLRAKVRMRPVRLKASLLTELKPSGKLAEPLISFLAEAHRRRGRIKEKSTAVSIFSSAKTFHLPERRHPNRGAILAPPAPFQGTGTFRREADHSVSWTGDLRVELPGFGEVRLTGPGTRATLCASPGCH